MPTPISNFNLYAPAKASPGTVPSPADPRPSPEVFGFDELVWHMAVAREPAKAKLGEDVMAVVQPATEETITPQVFGFEFVIDVVPT